MFMKNIGNRILGFIALVGSLAATSAFANEGAYQRGALLVAQGMTSSQCSVLYPLPARIVGGGQMNGHIYSSELDAWESNLDDCRRGYEAAHTGSVARLSGYARGVRLLLESHRVADCGSQIACERMGAQRREEIMGSRGLGDHHDRRAEMAGVSIGVDACRARVVSCQRGYHDAHRASMSR